MTPQTPAAGERRGSASLAAGFHDDAVLAEMNRQARAGIPNLDNVTDPDVIGAYGLEYDGPRCAGDDCRTPVDNDGELCDDCGDQPHAFQPHDPPRWPNWCACGRIRAAREHNDERDDQ